MRPLIISLRLVGWSSALSGPLGWGRGEGKGAQEEEEGDRKDPTLPARFCSISAPFCNKAPWTVCLHPVFSTPSPISDPLHQAPPVLTKLKDFYFAKSNCSFSASLHLTSSNIWPTLVTSSTLVEFLYPISASFQTNPVWVSFAGPSSLPSLNVAVLGQSLGLLTFLSIPFYPQWFLPRPWL